MKLIKLNFVTLFLVFSIQGYCITNKEIHGAIADFFHKNDIKKDFSINKKINLPRCEKEVEIRKKFNSFKTLEILCNDGNKWSYVLRTKIDINKNNTKKKAKAKKNKITLIKLKQNLKKGHKITREDIFVENDLLSKL